MTPAPTPVLDPRIAATCTGELLRALPAYVPELRGTPGGPAWAMLQVLGRYMQVLIERLNQAPDKNKLAFLDLMGVNLLSAQAARAPVVFEPLPNVADGHIAARTRVGAKIPSQSDPLVFETEQAIALAGGKLAEVISLWPARDSFTDHSAAAANGSPFNLFGSLKPVRHEFYLGHDVDLALVAQSTVSLQFELSTPGGTPLEISWEYWTGSVWQPFVVSDATHGLTRSGVVRLSTDCGASKRTTIDGIEKHWVRGVLTAILPPDEGAVLAMADRIRLWSVISHPLASKCSGDVRADKAYSNAASLDLTKTFYPLGRTPDNNSALYFTSEEVFSKPGAAAQLCFTRVITPEEEADKLAADQLATRALALELHISAIAATIASDAASCLRAVAIEVGGLPVSDSRIIALSSHAATLSALAGAMNNIASIQSLQNEIGKTSNVASQLNLSVSNDNMVDSGPPYADVPSQLVPLAEALRDLNGLLIGVHAPAIFTRIKSALLRVLYLGVSLVDATDVLFTPHRGDLQTANGALNTVMEAFEEIDGMDAAIQPAKDVGTQITNVINDEPDVAYSTIYTAIVNLLGTAQHTSDVMLNIAQSAGNGTVDANGPKLDPPRLRWEYWDGSKWRTLLSESNVDANNFLGSGTISFTVPTDFEASTVEGQTARWVRVRIGSGSYNQLKFVTWKDDVTGGVTSMAILQPRPPALEGFFLGYVYHSPVAHAEACAAINDFVWERHTNAAHWGGSPFAPFHPVADRTPALYLGFDRVLPADLLSVYFNLKENAAHTSGPPLVWEYWRGSAWSALTVTDETRDLALPGMVSVLWPGPALPTLARFGTARTWIRVRLENEGDPLSSRVLGIYPNAVWAANLQTVENEVMGSSDGEPDQTVFFRQSPVVEGEAFEVRELDGARAAVELPMLREELLRDGLTDADIKVVADARTGKTREVWVSWRVLPNLLFSGPRSRDATIERTRGRLILGDGIHGRIPPGGLDNIRASRYRYGGGRIGNVAATSLSQLLSGVTAKGVSNPRNAEGGADDEAPARVLVRGPRVIRHRYRAITAQDYEDLAREASPGVALSRALPATTPDLRPAPGWVTVIIVPQSEGPRPQPSFQLRERVQQYLAARTPAAIGGVAVIGPKYLAVGVNATVTPRDPQQRKAVFDTVTATLTAFFHPLTGGPNGEGWPFGRSVYLSDVAAVVEGVDGVDYASRLELLVDDTPWGDVIPVPVDRIVVAGRLRVLLGGAEA